MSETTPETKDSMDQFHEDAVQNTTSEVEPGTVLESGYRLLRRGDVVQGSDEILKKGKWRPVPPREAGWKIDKVRGVRRRKTPEGHFQDLQALATSTTFSGEQLERAAETLLKVDPEYRILGSHETMQPGDVVQRVLDGRQIPTDRNHWGEPASVNGPDFISLRASGRAQDPVSPVKPFTPNKYTRDMPTLDGRTVPVDVYCVLAAFPTGSAAVDHAVKKELAPGQRGVKTRLQDLKEARASLDRAIQLEEAVQG